MEVCIARSPRHGAPILRISQDIILEIVNAYVSNFPAASTSVLRRLSNVCREWRSLILESPTLWRKVVDTCHLDNAWGDEVMKRTGTAPLWVRGDSTYPIFIGFLSRYWDRIERLDVSAPIDLTRAERDFQVFYQPAPNLTYCKVRLSGLKKNIIPIRLRNLFGDIAPNLQELKAPLPFANGGWLTQIRVMEFPYFFSVSEVLDALSQMNMIEEATMQISQVLTISPRAQTLLPRLRRLRLKGSLLGSLTVMENLKPALCCSVHLSINPPYPHYRVFFQLALQQVPRYMENCFGLRADLEIHLNFKDQDMFYHAHGDASKFKLKIANWTAIEMGCISALEGFTHFTQATILTLNVDEFERGLHPVLRSLATSFLRSITCLDIRADEEVLEIMVPKASSVPFPSLQKIKARSFVDGNDEKTRHQAAIIVDFIVQRQVWGFPISLLENFFHGDELVDMSRLEQVGGLMVLWRIDEGPVFEYVCGSGNRNKLRIDAKSYVVNV